MKDCTTTAEFVEATVQSLDQSKEHYFSLALIQDFFGMSVIGETKIDYLVLF